jgi:hypothetical protein
VSGLGNATGKRQDRPYFVIFRYSVLRPIPSWGSGSKSVKIYSSVLYARSTPELGARHQFTAAYIGGGASSSPKWYVPFGITCLCMIGDTRARS